MEQKLIDKEQAYQVLSEYYHHRMPIQHKALREALDRVPVVEAIPTEWIKEWIEEHHEYASRVTITWLLDDWEQEKHNG